MFKKSQAINLMEVLPTLSFGNINRQSIVTRHCYVSEPAHARECFVSRKSDKHAL